MSSDAVSDGLRALANDERAAGERGAGEAFAELVASLDAAPASERLDALHAAAHAHVSWARFLRDASAAITDEGSPALVQLALAGRGGEALRDAAEAFVASGRHRHPHLRRLDATRAASREAKHDGAVRAVDVHETGLLALSGGDDGAIRLWDLETGACVARVSAHPAGVVAVRFARGEGALAVSIGRDRSMRRVDLAAGTWSAAPGVASRLFTPRALIGAAHAGRPIDLAVLESYDRTTARVVALDTGELVATLRSSDHGVVATAIEPSGARALTGGWAGAVLLWDLATGRAEALAHVHRAPITAVAFGPDGASAVAADAEGRILRWKLPSGEPACGVVAHAGPVHALAVHARLGRVASIGRDGALVVRDAGTCARLARWEAAERLTSCAVARAADRVPPTYRTSGRTRADTLVLGVGDVAGRVGFLALAGPRA